MKKLMIAAAIVCAAVISHGAAYQWCGTEYLMDGSGTIAKGSVEFFWNGESLGSIDISGVGEVVFDFTGLAGPDNTVSPEVTATAKAIATITNFAGSETGTMEWSETFTKDMMDNAGGAEAHSAYLAQMANVALLNEGNFDLSKSAAENGYTAVPEPTSGLLLLLGVAGLALRRRRA